MNSFLTMLPLFILAGYVGLIAWIFLTEKARQTAWLAIWNALVVLVAICLLPWITTEGDAAFDARVHKLSLDPSISMFLQKAQIEGWWQDTPILYAALTCHADDVPTCLAAVPDGLIKQFAFLARADRSIEGLHIALQINGASPLLRGVIIASFAWGILQLLWGIALLSGSIPVNSNRVSGWILAITGICIAPFLLWYLPIVDTLGHRDRFGVSVVTFLAAAQVGSGIGWTLIGTIVGTCLALLQQSSVPDRDEYLP